MTIAAVSAHVAIVGAGQAGVALAARLRSKGHAGAITLIGAEDAPPYQRPPLSKAYLMGTMPEDRLHLRNAHFYAEAQIDLVLGHPVTRIDTVARTLTFRAASMPYDVLALTTGSVARRLPASAGGDLGGVYAVRSLADVDAMRAEFAPGRRVVIVGGGYIGLEAAAVAAKLGLAVTVVEMAPRILSRVASAETAAHVRALHQSHGVTLIEGTGLAHLEGAGRVRAAHLADGRVIACDFVIAGVGIAPDTGLAEDAGLTLANGIATDCFGRTSDPHVWAAGDCASFPWQGGSGQGGAEPGGAEPGGRLRLESVQNAIDMAECVADNILGAGRSYAPVPWFWSDQFDLKLQIAGLNTGHDRVVARGDTSVWYYAGDRLLAVDALNDPRAFMVAKRLLEAGRSADPSLVADPAVDIRALLG